MKRLSICITTYNQSNYLRWNLENLLQYPGDDIEIVVSDNCSEEGVKGLVDSFHDSRIKYCRTRKNIGHDRNILHAFRNCDSKYAFLLRTKDSLIPEKISTVIESIRELPDIAYWRFACVDQNGNSRGYLPDHVYKRGEEAILSYSKLMNHPSGELYNLNYLTREDFDKYETYFEDPSFMKQGFIVHDLIRMDLAVRGDFMSSSKMVWIYVDNDKTPAVNSLSNRRSVYAPDYQYPRYAGELTFVKQNLPEELQMTALREVMRLYCHGITIAFKYINQDKVMQAHYSCDEEDFSVREERKRFYDFTLTQIADLPDKQRSYLKRYLVFCLTVMQARWEASHFLGPLIKEKMFGAVIDLKEKLVKK